MNLEQFLNRGFDSKLKSVILSIADSSIEISNALQDVEKRNAGQYSKTQNSSGDFQSKMDITSDKIFDKNFSQNEHIFSFLSEEQPEPTSNYDNGEFIVYFDPIDGSSNIAYNVSVGSTFSIFNKNSMTSNSMLISGKYQVAAGYIMYGSRTIMVITEGSSVEGFSLIDGQFEHSMNNIRIPDAKIYSINEGYYERFDEDDQKYLNHIKQTQKYSLRYIGTMVSDIHRTLIGGGIFLLPKYEGNPNGKLRLMYEVNPLGWMIQIAGGKSLSNGISPLEIKPANYHQKVPFVAGSELEVNKYLEYQM